VGHKLRGDRYEHWPTTGDERCKHRVDRLDHCTYAREGMKGRRESTNPLYGDRWSRRSSGRVRPLDFGGDRTDHKDAARTAYRHRLPNRHDASRICLTGGAPVWQSNIHDDARRDSG
jgi:hypothetical protein